MAEADLVTPPTFRAAAPKPKMTVYYALLIIALIAMLAACLFMYLEIRRFQRDARGVFINPPSQTLIAFDRDAVRPLAV